MEDHPYPPTTASHFTTVVLVGLMTATIFGLLSGFVFLMSHAAALPGVQL